jgi:hypothetical protein
MKSFKTGIVMVAALVMAALGFMSCSSNNAKLISITITPAEPVIVSEIQLTATGTFSGGMVLNYTSEVIWSSSSPTVATVGTTAGLTGFITVLGPGVTTITAFEPNTHLSSSATLTVATPISITITPGKPFMAIGTSHQFDAIATFPSPTSLTLKLTQSLLSSPSLTWRSSDTSIATVSRGFVTTGTTTGTTIISASTGLLFSGVTGTTTLTVTPSIVTSITVSPVAATLAVGANQPYTATGHYLGIADQDFTSLVNWTSSPTGTILVSNETGSKGMVSSSGPGTAFIIATDPISGVTGSTSVTFFAP